MIKGRTTNDYYYVWEQLINESIRQGFDVPEDPTIILDFEKASANAFASHFPTGRIFRCHFHMWQTILKNLKKKGVYRLYQVDNVFHVWVKKVGALAFLPENQVTENFMELYEECAQGAKDFCNYFDETFVRGKCIRVTRGKPVYSGPKYNISEWNVFCRFDTDLESTTNVQEAMNYKLQSCNHSGDHPTLFRLATLLLDFNSRVCHQMEQHIIAGAPKKKSTKECMQRKTNLLRLWEKYKKGEMEVADYLFGCAGNMPDA